MNCVGFYKIKLRKLFIILFGFIVLVIVGCSDKKNNAERVQCSAERPMERQYPKKSLPKNMKLVSDEYGYAKILSGKTIYTAHTRGWSSWWFPLNETDFFSGDLAPLLLYDQWVFNTKRQKTTAAEWHKNNLYNPAAQSWEGYCAPRAFASAFEPIIEKPVIVDGLCVTPGQLKGLITLTYENVSPKKWQGIYGQQYLQGADDYALDIYPEQLLRFAQIQVGVNKESFLMDNSSNRELWMDVVHKVFINIDENDKDGGAVDMRITFHTGLYEFTENQKNSDMKKGLNVESATRTYNAKLYGCWSGDVFEAQSGEWVGDSEFDHPDYVIEIPKDRSKHIEPNRGSNNPEISVSWVDELNKKALQSYKHGYFCSP